MYLRNIPCKYLTNIPELVSCLAPNVSGGLWPLMAVIPETRRTPGSTDPEEMNVVKRYGPMVGRRKLGSLLRQLREQAALKGADVAKEIGCTASKVSRIEGAELIPSRAELLATANLVEATQEQRDVLLQLLDEAKRKGWYESYEGVLPSKFANYVGLEMDATSLRAYEPLVIHGLLQVEVYTRALWVGGSPGEHPQDVEKLVEVRMRRREALTRTESPLQMWAILEEAALRRPIGGAQVMREQLHHLNEITAELPNVSIRVLPTKVGAHPGLNGPFSILGFDPGESDVVYVEGQGGNLYLEKPRDLRRADSNYNHLLAEALSQKDSVKQIETIAKDFS